MQKQIVVNTLANRKKVGPNLTFSSVRELSISQQAVEHAMDYFDNGTWQMKALRKLNGILTAAWNAHIKDKKAA